jgi:hypothetical protein
MLTVSLIKSGIRVSGQAAPSGSGTEALALHALAGGPWGHLVQAKHSACPDGPEMRSPTVLGF